MVKDHLGNTYENIRNMCEKYNVNERTYRSRLSKGWSQEKALTHKVIRYDIKDHLGSRYSTIAEMCRHYNINVGVYWYRIKKGYTQEQALVGYDEQKPIIKDHQGKIYRTIIDMCREYKQDMDVYSSRIAYGWDIKSALEIPIRKRIGKEITDHKGNKYIYQQKKCVDNII